MTTQQLLVPSNATLKRNVMDYSLIVVGSFLQALSYVLFLAPYKIVPGGVYGISIVIHYVTKDLFPFFPDGLPMGATALCFNIPLMILAMKKIGLSSGPKTIVTFLLISIFTDSLSYFLTDPLVENDAFIAAFYGGAILGLGVTCIFRAQSTSAGTDVLARVIANDSNLKVSNMIIVLDSAVVLLGLIVFKDWAVPLGMRGTFIHGKGMYQGNETEIIFTIAERKDMPRLKDEVKEIDPNAFVSTMHASKDSPRPGI